MVEEILQATGIKHKESRFLQTPDEKTYAIWDDDVSVRGADDVLLIEEHSSTIELYSTVIDEIAEAKIEAELNARGIAYEKSEHTWLDKEQLYETVYDFKYTKKRR